MNLEDVVASLNKQPVVKKKDDKKVLVKKGKPESALRGSVTGYNAKAPAAAAVLAASTGIAPVVLNPQQAALPLRMKHILDYLLEHCSTRFTPQQLQQSTSHDLAADQELLKELHRHPRVRTAPAGPSAGSSSQEGAPLMPAAWYSYKPEVEGVTDKVTMLNYVRDLKGRAAMADLLRKCYVGAANDLQALKREGKIFIIGHPDPDQDAVFECNLMGQDKVSDGLKALWLEVTQEHIPGRVPSDVQDLQAAVVRAGLRSALAHLPAKRLATGPKEKRAKKPRQQRFNVHKATNAHLPQLFNGAQPTNIDS